MTRSSPRVAVEESCARLSKFAIAVKELRGSPGAMASEEHHRQEGMDGGAQPLVV